MGKSKKRKQAAAKPWCWYCDREFEDDKVLIQHQRQRHFKCNQCNKRLNTSGGLQIHMQQVHKTTLTLVHNALPGRDSMEIEIFGMEGVPLADLMAHNERLVVKDDGGAKRARTDMHRDAEELQREFEAFRERKEVLRGVPAVVSFARAEIRDGYFGGHPMPPPMHLPSHMGMVHGYGGYGVMPQGVPMWGPPAPTFVPPPMLPVHNIVGQVHPGANAESFVPQETSPPPQVLVKAEGRMVFRDNEVSMEEKRALLSMYSKGVVV